MNDEEDPTTAEINNAPAPVKARKRRKMKASKVDIDYELSQLRNEVNFLRKQQIQQAPARDQHVIASEPAETKISISELEAAKALIDQAQGALGIEKPKGEGYPAFHPPQLEDPAQGDKTPAVVEWYRKNAPEEYERRYAGRKTHLEDRRNERRGLRVPIDASVATFPDDPDGIVLSKTDDSGRTPQVL